MGQRVHDVEGQTVAAVMRLTRGGKTMQTYIILFNYTKQ